MKKKLLVSLFIISSLGSIALIFIKRTTQEVYVSAATQGTATNATAGNVRVLSEYEVDLVSECHGKVLEILPLNENGCGPLTKGQLIIQLDTSQIDREITELKTKMAGVKEKISIGSNLKIDSANLEKDIELYEKLKIKGNYPEQELERRYQDRERLERALALENLQQKQELELLEVQLQKQEALREKMSIQSPLNGLLTEFTCLPGTTIFAGARLGKLISDKKLIEISVNEEDCADIAVNQEVFIQLLGHKDKLYKGYVTSIYPASNPRTKRRIVYAALDHNEVELLPGMTGQASIVKSKRDNALIIPRRALIGNFVYVVNKGKIELREVVPGYLGADSVEILSKLNPGECVVTDNLLSYRNGQRVKLKIN